MQQAGHTLRCCVHGAPASVTMTVLSRAHSLRRAVVCLTAVRKDRGLNSLRAGRRGRDGGRAGKGQVRHLAGR
jgi:hypothetical protein